MFKKTKLITFSLFLLPSLTTTACITSCGNPNEDEVEKFIYDRTFCFGGFSMWSNGKDEIVGPADMGTAWIVEDATPKVANDYCYYLATNMHVQHAHETFVKDIIPDESWAQEDSPYHYLYGRQCSRIEYRYADESLSDRADKIILKDKYLPFESIGYGDNIGLGNFTFKNETDASEWYIPCIDMFVYKADFGTPTGKILEKLNRLNTQRSEKGYINQFANADEQGAITDHMYIGGYPVVQSEDQTAAGAQWKTHAMNGTDIRLNAKRSKSDVGKAIEPFHIGDPDHDINGNVVPPSPFNPVLERFYYYSIAPSYTYEPATPVQDDWMGGGASGSMIVNDKLEICAINFGTAPLEMANAPCRPFFELFKTNDGDFISKWTNKQKKEV